MSERDELNPAWGNFYEAFRPYSAVEWAQLRWRMPKLPQVLKQERRNNDHDEPKR
jgi:hypothetical protein